MAVPAIPSWLPAVAPQSIPVDIGTAYYPRGIAAPAPLGLPPGPFAAGPAGPGAGAIPMGRAQTAAERIVAALESGRGSSTSSARTAAQSRLAQAAAGTQGTGRVAAPPVQAAARQAAGARAATVPPAAVSQMAGAAPAGAPTVAATGRLAGLLGRGGAAAPTWLTARLAGQGTAGLGLRSLAAGSLGRASLFGAAGQVGGMGVEAITGAQEGTWDDALRNGTVGAGIGAGIGSVVPIIGTGIGGALGFGAGAAHGWLTGRGSKEGEAERAYDKRAEGFNEAFNRYNASDDLREQFMMQFRLSTDGLGRKEVNQTAEAMAEMLPQLLMEDRALREQERGQAAMYAAAQSWMAPMLQSAQERTAQYGDELSQSMLMSAEQIPNDARRAFAIDEAKRIPLDIASQQAYSMQMMMSLPGLYGMQTEAGSNGVPAMDFQSIMGAQPLAPGAIGNAPMAGMGGPVGAQPQGLPFGILSQAGQQFMRSQQPTGQYQG